MKSFASSHFCQIMISIFAFMGLISPSFALDEIVMKQTFKISQYTTLGGQTIFDVKIGFETYGKLNADKSNVILITHYFSGNSHAAGKYAATDLSPGYWNQIIGPGQALDTSKYFIISSDTLVNINPKDPTVVTTGPLSINPKTKKTYGSDFPVVSYGDLVRVQKALLESLGITKLQAVAGPSAGSMQALQWAADFPQAVGKVIAVISPGLSMPALSVATLNGWSKPILRDLKWKQGRYSKGNEPTNGLADALQAVTVSAVDFAWADKNFGQKPADPSKMPLQDLNHQYLIESKLEEGALLRTKNADANSFLYMVRLNQAFNIEDKISSGMPPVLFISVKTDLLFPPELVDVAAQKIKAVGGKASVVKIEGIGGHLAGLTDIQKASDQIKDFLNKK